MAQGKSDQKYLQDHLTDLVNLGQRCRSVSEKPYNEFKSWTPLKLIVLKTYVELYTKILTRQRLKRLHFKSKVFIDVFSGSGLNQITFGSSRKAPDIRHRAWVPGSTLIAAEWADPTSRFDKIYALENDEEKLRALQLRMNSLYQTQQFEPILGMAEEKLPDVVKRISNEDSHYLAFVDYEDITSLPLNLLEPLLRERGDIFVTFLTSGIRRCFGAATESAKSENTLREFLSDDVFHELSEKELRKGLSLNDIGAALCEKIGNYKDIVRWIPIRSGSTGYQYLLIFGVVQTSHGSPFIKLIERTRERMESLSGADVKKMLPIACNTQKQLF